MPAPADPDRALARALCAFIDASPTPFHACTTAIEALEGAGFKPLEEHAEWPAPGGDSRRFYVRRGASLVAWSVPEDAPAWQRLRLIGAHTDSPNLRVKPRPDLRRQGLRLVGVEVYGGVLLNTWLDRDLGLAGRAFVRGKGGPEERLFRLDDLLVRIPQLAIHLNREVNSAGLVLNPQQHMNPVLGLDDGGPGLRERMAAALDCAPDALLAWDAMFHDAQGARLVGDGESLVSAPRLDNLCSCFCGLEALLRRTGAPQPGASVPVLVLFDHEEVGSTSSRGAQSAFLRQVLERIVAARGGTRDDFLRALAQSVCASCDMAHATHPAYPEKHDLDHPVRMNAGPAIKTNVNQRYASEAATEALFLEACERAGVRCQQYVNRGDLPCGSTIGPLTAAGLGVATVDVGNPQWAMHSARELCGADDPAQLVAALTAFLE
jgi:aspartyl aminopeptidase